MLTENKSIVNTLEIVLLLLYSISSLLIVSSLPIVKGIVYCQFYLLAAIMIFDYFRHGAFNLFQIWMIAYIFIVQAEMVVISSESHVFSEYIIPFFRFSISNSLVLFGYHLTRNRKITISKVYKPKKTRAWFWVLLVLSILYYVSVITRVVDTIYYGRRLSAAIGASSLHSSINGALGLVLPALYGYYFKYVIKKNPLYSLIFVLPIFACLLVLATRFRLLFSVMPYIIILDVMNVKRIDMKHNILLALILLVLITVSSFLVEYRNVSLNEILVSDKTIQNNGYSDESESLTYNIANNLSPEGVVWMARVADDYFSKHNLHYGKESTILLYFWFPRAIWKDKPYQLDYWLVREYYKVADNHSTASGFLGELRADFGWGALAFMLLFGMALKRGDSYIRSVFRLNSASSIFCTLLFPLVFFFVRSPLTATPAFLFEVFVFLVVRKLLFTQTKIN